MKFFIPVLLMAAAAYAQDCMSQVEDLTEECLILTIDESNYEESCKKLLGEKCQKFLNDPFSVATACKSDPTFSSIFTDQAMEGLKIAANVSCAKDGTGKKCPVADLSMLISFETENLVKDSCPSKTCSNALGQYLDYALKTNENADYKKMKEELAAEDCVKQQKDDTNSAAGAPGGAQGGAPGGAPAGDAPSGGAPAGGAPAGGDDSSDARLAAKVGGTLVLSLLLSLVAFF